MAAVWMQLGLQHTNLGNMNPLLPTWLIGKNEDDNPYKVSRHAENKIALRLATLAEKHCQNLIHDFNECARGRSVSMVFACRDKYNISQECVRAYVNEDALLEVKKRWVDAGRPRQVDWNMMLAGFDKPPPPEIAALEAAAAQHRKDAVVLLAVLGCLAAPALASGDPTEKLPGVNDLSAENFSTFVTGTKAALVEFYAPWCGHCKHLVPEYKKLGEIVQNDPKLKNRVVIAKVDADKHRSVGEQFGVQGFPTIKFFPRGKAPTKDNARDYNGARTAEAFVEFLQKELEADKGFARVKALDELTKSFLTAADKAAVVKQVTDKVAELSGADKDNGAVYVKLMQKGIEKGNDWLGKEKARLEKMLSSGSVSMLKVAELGSKVSVLGHILGDDE